MVQKLRLGSILTGLLWIDDLSSNLVKKRGRPVKGEEITPELIEGSNGEVLVALLYPEFPDDKGLGVVWITNEWDRENILENPSYLFVGLGCVDCDYYAFPADLLPVEAVA
jgi:hypothetical protein